MTDTKDVPEVSWRQVHAFRLRNHHLDHRAPRGDLVDVVRDTGGIQAQVPSAAELALRARVRGHRREDLRRALEGDRTLVRGWLLRYAVHVIPAADFLLYTRALLPRLQRSLAWYERRGLGEREVMSIVDRIAEELRDGPLPRKVLAARLSSKLGERARRLVEHAWGGLVVQTCLRGDACFGPTQGNEITFVSPRGWLSRLKDYSEEEAARVLVRRYVHAFGPASPSDFQRWTEIPMASAKAAWARASEDLVEVRVDGTAGWVSREDLPDLRRKTTEAVSVRLLPTFDAFLLGHRDKGHLVDAAHYKRVYRVAGWISSVVLIDGRAAGVWSHRQSGDGWRVTIEPFRRLSRAEREGVAGEVEDLGRFLGGAAEFDYERTG